MIIGITAIVIGRSQANEVVTASGPAPASPAKKDEPLPLDFFVYAFASGYLVFATEVVEVHLLTLLIGNSAYAFA